MHFLLTLQKDVRHGETAAQNYLISVAVRQNKSYVTCHADPNLSRIPGREY
jgi:hypothetical protein